MVVHAAACKHVDFCELNPAMAWRVNVNGTKNVCAHAGRRRVVVVSTDKAIEPTCVMGRTKQEAEHIAISSGANVAVFGNVLGTRGSLVPMVLRCAKLGRPIPLTDPRMTRFFMTIDQACHIIFEGLFGDLVSNVLVPEEPRSAFVWKLLEVCRDELAPGAEIVRVGARPGERLHEPMRRGDDSLVWSNERACLMTRSQIRGMLVQARILPWKKGGTIHGR
jgi:UDP-N-acetylglucosamine 4,6-dehydratase